MVSEITVYRDGKSQSIPCTELVPGDICMLVGGDVVPADIKWLRGDVMSMDTAALTGEPLPRKYPSPDYGDILLSGTTVKAGECYGQVLYTATNTEIGKAQAEIMKDKSVVVVSAFQKKIMVVVQALVCVSIAIVIAVLIVDGTVYGGFTTDSRTTVLSALSILIASIPVALPLVLQVSSNNCGSLQAKGWWQRDSSILDPFSLTHSNSFYIRFPHPTSKVNLALGASFLAKEHHAIVTSIPALQDIARLVRFNDVLC